MPGTVIGKKLNLGYAGKVARSADRIIINRMYEKSNTEALAFGLPVFLDTNGCHGWATGNTSAQFVGISAATVVQSTTYGANDGEYTPGKPMDILVRGTVVVELDATTQATAGAKVYWHTTKKAFTATADTATTPATVEIPGAHFATGFVDANKCAEVVLTDRNLI